MDNIITVALAVFASTGLWTFVGKVYDNRKAKRTPLEKMVLAIGRDRLLFLCKKYLREGYIPLNEFESFKAMEEAYVSLGGNSGVKKLYEQCEELEVMTDEAKN